MNCKDLRVRSKNYKKYIYCKKKKTEINYDDCKVCEDKNYKTIMPKPTKNQNKVIAKLERNRFSIITNTLDHCIECGSFFNVDLHEVFYGHNRKNSMKYGCVIPLCRECHTGINGIHFNSHLNYKWKKIIQARFEEIYSNEQFIDIFKKNYLTKEGIKNDN